MASSSSQLRVSIPQQHTLLLAFNRPSQRNAITPGMAREIDHVLNWFDNEPSLWVAVVTGEGDTFCAGADLKSWHASQSSNDITEQQALTSSLHGFASISRRRTSFKPIIAAVNGPAYGGGVEIILNCDLVVASTDAVFALPEVKRGVLAAQGGIPRLARVAGHQLASEMLLLGITVTALEARDKYRFINIVTPPTEVLPTALALARTIISNSPDSVQSGKEGLLIAQRIGDVEEAVVSHALSKASGRLWNGKNVKEGLAAFVEKRTPKWTNPAKL
ncbi:ClpP/crotonase-like domain-containing protein [Pisolithus marmoratus]|nr:ClpP/crotonase-like domain-containing protein [Pisolithus marmoratus]